MQHHQKQLPKPAKVQPKLQVNQPGDSFEQEADAMADRVMRMADAHPHQPVSKPVTGIIARSVQRKCAHCEEEEKKLMRKAEAGSSGMSVSSSFASSLNASKGGGSSLPPVTRSFMEKAFSTDFSKVKIHTDNQAAALSEGINAKAFTYGSDIYFNNNQYSPGTDEGKKLLSHELTHVVQQDGSIRRQVAPPTVGSAPPTLSASEAAERVQLRLFDSGGFFATQNQKVDQFKTDMMALGWFAGDRRSGSAGVTVSTTTQIALQEAAKAAAKKAVEILLESLTGVVAAAGGGVASGLVGILASELIRINSYDPVITERASKPAHQIFIESTQATIRSMQEQLRDQWTLQRDETISAIGTSGISQYADRIRTATANINSNYYTELVARFLPFAESRSLELETPHAVYTGEGRGFTPFVGSSTYVSTITGGEIYVQLSADRSFNLSVVRTVIPELRSGVLSQLNSQSQRFSTLPVRRLIIEADSPLGPARIVWNSSSSSFDIPVSPHFSREFCRQVYRARTGDTGLDRVGGDSSGLTQHQFAGAVHVYGWILGLPLNQMNFHA